MSDTSPVPIGRVSRRTALGLAGGGTLAASGLLAGATPAHAETSLDEKIPADTRPGGAYDRFVRKLAEEDKFSGTILLTHRGKKVLSRSYGMADREKSIPNRANTTFALASASKPFTGLAILQLAERGKLAFGKPLGTYLDGFADDIAKSVTIHHLLTHTSGLNLGLGDEEYTKEYLENHHKWNSAAEVMGETLRIIKKQPLAFTPGTRFGYSNAGFHTLGVIVEAVSGQTFHDYVREHIFEPAGMKRSDYFTRPQWLTDSRIAHPYWLDDSGKRRDALTSDSVLGGTANMAREFIGTGAGNGFTTAGDLVRFAAALGDGKLLSPAYAEVYQAGKFPPTPLPKPNGTKGSTAKHPFMAYGGGAGLIAGCRMFGHSGGSAGENTNWDIYRDRDWVTVILSNYGPLGADDYTVVREMLDEERKAIFG